MEKTISIRRIGELAVRPNTYRKTFDIISLCETYLMAYNEMAAITDEIKKNLYNRANIILKTAECRRGELLSVKYKT